MDRPLDQPCHAQTRFPRTRGDGPHGRRYGHIVGVFPPHTRGWTGVGFDPEPFLCVSPAHAGMDRCNVHANLLCWSFPRTRGDGPALVGAVKDVLLFPPHTRGWTSSKHQKDGHCMVSPAHAGMDRTLTHAARPYRSFPRTRGDGPLVAFLEAHNDMFPPHTRGWTGGPGGPGHGKGVSPAHAGMDPCDG